MICFFIHVFRNCRERLGKVQKSKPLGIAQACKTCEPKMKRSVELMMKANDSSATESFEQINIASIVDNDKESGIAALQLYDRIACACEELNYVDSYLYKNCKRKGEGKPC